jgi:hypothetical protein
MKIAASIDIKNEDVRAIAPSGNIEEGFTILVCEDGSRVSIPNVTIRRIQAVWDVEYSNQQREKPVEPIMKRENDTSDHADVWVFGHVEVICADCGEVVTKSVKIRPRSISEWDIEHGRTRDDVYVCCGKIRMIHPKTGEKLSYELRPEDLVSQEMP